MSAIKTSMHGLDSAASTCVGTRDAEQSGKTSNGGCDTKNKDRKCGAHSWKGQKITRAGVHGADFHIGFIALAVGWLRPHIL